MTEENEFRELQFKYWTKRLDHTLTHTQTASKLIYTIDGAILALAYFLVKEFEPSPRIIVVAATLLGLLAALNILHAWFLCVQRKWYGGIDAKLQRLVRATPVPGRRWGSTQLIHAGMHVLIAAALASLAVLMHSHRDDPIPKSAHESKASAASPSESASDEQHLPARAPTD